MSDDAHDERTVRCPVEGYEQEVLARGINLHIRRSADERHGPQGEVPDDLNLSALETVGTEAVEMDYPDERDTDDVRRLCPYCSQTFTGDGILIHLGQTAGRKNHPENAAENHTADDFPRVRVDAYDNIIRVADGSVDATPGGRVPDTVPVERVYRLLASLIAENDHVTAHRVRKQLLGIDTPDRPLRSPPIHPKLFGHLLQYCRADQSDQQLTAALEQSGIMVALDDITGFYTADEARDLAAYLERTTERHDGVGAEIHDLIGFLKEGADRLERDALSRHIHEEFRDWR